MEVDPDLVCEDCGNVFGPHTTTCQSCICGGRFVDAHRVRSDMADGSNGFRGVARMWLDQIVGVDPDTAEELALLLAKVRSGLVQPVEGCTCDRDSTDVCETCDASESCFRASAIGF